MCTFGAIRGHRRRPLCSKPTVATAALLKPSSSGRMLQPPPWFVMRLLLFQTRFGDHKKMSVSSTRGAKIIDDRNAVWVLGVHQGPECLSVRSSGTTRLRPTPTARDRQSTARARLSAPVFSVHSSVRPSAYLEA